MARLTAADRRRIPQSKYALPGKRYPVENESHARAALQEVSVHGNAHEKAVVRAHVHRMYPNIKIGGE